MDVHATGHAKADDIKTYLSIVNPEWFVPIHGEYRHMVANAKLGELMGVSANRIIQCEDGDVLELTSDGLDPVGRVPSGYLYVDGIVGDVGNGVLRDRRKLAEEGVVVVVSTVDMQTGKVLVQPEIITRGWVYAPEAEDLLDEACDTVAVALEKALADGVRDVEQLEREARKATGKFVSDRTKRRPHDRPRRHGGVAAPDRPLRHGPNLATAVRTSENVLSCPAPRVTRLPNVERERPFLPGTRVTRLPNAGGGLLPGVDEGAAVSWVSMGSRRIVVSASCFRDLRWSDHRSSKASRHGLPGPRGQVNRAGSSTRSIES